MSSCLHYMKLAIITVLLFGALALSPFVAPANAQRCDPNDKGACIQPYSQGDVDCSEIKDRNFRSVGSDPHRLDRDKNGMACESR